MSDSRYDSYRYDNNSRRTVRAGSEADRSSEQRSHRSVPRYAGTDTEQKTPGILYDARGVRIRKSRFSGNLMQTLLFFVLPYLVFNAIVFLLVTSAPKIEISVSGTDDYRTVTAEISIRSLLPIKETSVTLGSEELPCTKSGSSLTVVVPQNGTLYVDALSVNGMRSTAHSVITVLDDTAPSIENRLIENGVLSCTISDTQSGVDWDSIYGILPDKSRVAPIGYDRETGSLQIPMAADSMDLFCSDMVGNSRLYNITATEEQLNVSGPVTE